jgi:Tol biopolymer transport system component
VTQPPDPNPGGFEHLLDAISDGGAVEWERERERGHADAETLDVLKMIDSVARVHRGDVPLPDETEIEGERAWGALVIRSPLGAGVYGEVYRAYDPALRREVALKLWSKTERPRVIAQLLTEARALAQVRHPNVLTVLGADVHDGRAGMWTELLDGVTLEQLIVHSGSADWREAAIYGIGLCRALAAVHAVGFVHRDVKASNVMRERGGRIVLMDFGSAGYFHESGAESGDEPHASIQGTPLTMAPEVLAGAAATPASDLFSLGVLLFRLTTGSYPVQAEKLTELRDALDREPLPSPRSLRPDVPIAFAAVIEQALERDPAARIATAAEFERLLAQALRADLQEATVSASPAPAASPARRAWLPAAMWTAAVGLLLAAALWWSRRTTGFEPPTPMQFTIQIPAGEHVSQYANVVISPDGTTIAFAGTDTLGTTALWTRRFDALTAERLPGTEGAIYPFWSPDSRAIAFFSLGSLKRVSLNGGAVRTLCAATLGRGGSWSANGTIVFAAATEGPLLRVPATGGTPIAATTLDASSGELSHRWPSFLPDGEHFLYVSTPARAGTHSLYVGSLNSDRRVHVGDVGSGAVYSSGHLIYVSNQTLEARPFNLHSLEWNGDPLPISDLPGIGGSIAEPHASVSRNGTLVSSSLTLLSRRLQWADLVHGEVLPLAAGAYFDPTISPDGAHIAAERSEGTGRSNVWIIDPHSGMAERWTNADALNRHPVWSPRGDSLLFSSNRSGHYALYQRSFAGPDLDSVRYSPERTLLMWPTGWQPGGLVSLDRFETGAGYNVSLLQGGKEVPIARSPASEQRGMLSPDGRYIAYDSDASGHSRVHVYDRSTARDYALPDSAGQSPRWASATGDLFFFKLTGAVFQVRPQAGRTPDAWPSRQVFHGGRIESYDVDAHGKRMICAVISDTGRPEDILVLANLSQALKRGL